MAPSSPVEVLSGSAHPRLGAAIARELGVNSAPHVLERAPDGENLIRIDESLRGRAVAVVQPTCAPIGEHLLELLLLGDACWRVGARRILGVLPYLGYARQDRRMHPGQPLGAKALAEALVAAHLHRVLVVDPHNAAVEAGFHCPVELLTAVPVLADAVRAHAGDGCVVVAPDLGATKLAERYAQRLGMPMAVVHKERLGPRDVVAERIIGDVRSLTPIVVDDIVSTAGTVVAAVQLLLGNGARPPVLVVASHGLFAGLAVDRLRALPLAHVITTDSVPQPEGLPFPHHVVTLAPLLAEAIQRVHAGSALAVDLGS